MLEKYSETEKRYFGQLFEYYRIKKQIKWKEIQKIISQGSYSKIKNGQTLKSLVLYDDLFDLFDMRFEKRKDNFQSWLNDYLLRLESILESNQQDQLTFYYEEYEKELSPYKEENIYKEYYQIIGYILNYYKDSKYMNQREIEDTLLLIQYVQFENNLIIYLLETMYISNNNAVCSYPILERLNNVMESYDHPIILNLKANSLKMEGEFHQALNLFEKSSKYWKDKSNNYRLTKTLLGLFDIYKNISNLHADEIAIELLETKKTTPSFIPIINYNVGIYYYLNEEYEKAYPLFLENALNYERYKDWPFVGILCTILKKPIPKEIKQVDSSKSNDQVFIDYYIKKSEDLETKKLIDFLLSEVIQRLLNYQEKEPYWKIFEIEMQTLCNDSNKYYKAYFNYLKIMNKNAN